MFPATQCNLSEQQQDYLQSNAYVLYVFHVYINMYLLYPKQHFPHFFMLEEARVSMLRCIASLFDTLLVACPLPL